MKQLLFTVAILGSLLFSSCGFDKLVRIDNPTNEAITVSIDGEEPFTLAAFEHKRLEGIKGGKHTIKVGDNEPITFNIEHESVMLNPTQSTYIFAEEEYGAPSMEWKESVKEITLDGKKYKGHFEIVEGNICIDMGPVNYDAVTPFPNETSGSSGTIVRMKLYRKSDFKKDY
jgi:hypothetical protein